MGAEPIATHFPGEAGGKGGISCHVCMRLTAGQKVPRAFLTIKTSENHLFQDTKGAVCLCCGSSRMKD